MPQTVIDFFPDAPEFVESLGVQLIKVTSGFQGGVRDIRSWEEALRWKVALEDEWKDFYKAQAKSLEIVIDLNGPETDWNWKTARWKRGLQSLRLP